MLSGEFGGNPCDPLLTDRIYRPGETSDPLLTGLAVVELCSGKLVSEEDFEGGTEVECEGAGVERTDVPCGS